MRKILLIIITLGIVGYIVYPKSDSNSSSYESKVKNVLSNIYSSCIKYWAKTSSENDCTLAEIKKSEYNFSPPEDITIIVVAGDDTNFYAKANYNDNREIFTINSENIISKDKVATKSWGQKHGLR